MRTQTGFTLIEIAIVVVIIGLLLGGVLKGQELITAARVRNLAAQLDGVKIAYLGFQDRYRALPGDYSNAAAAATGNHGDALLHRGEAALSHARRIVFSAVFVLSGDDRL